MAVYLLHIEPAIAHARHYCGFAEDFRLPDRIAAHQAGKGARLTQVAVERGRTLTLARVWQGKGRKFERQLKNRKNAPKLCPICQGAPEGITPYAPGYISIEEWAQEWDACLSGEVIPYLPPAPAVPAAIPADWDIPF